MNTLFPHRCLFSAALLGAAVAWSAPEPAAPAPRNAELEVLAGKPAPPETATPWLPDYAAAFLEAQLALNAGNNERALARLLPLAARDNAPAEVFASIAEIHLAGNDAEKALAVLETGLRRHAAAADLHILRARALRQQGKFKAGIDALEAGLQYQPRRQEALSLLSELHLQQLRGVTSEDELNRAMQSLIGIYERMLTGLQGSERMPPLLILSQLQLRRNEAAPALAHAREATELDAREPRAWMALAAVQEASKQTTEALKAYTQALLLQPADSEVRERLDTLLKLRGPRGQSQFYIGLAREYPAIKELQDTAARLLLQEARWAEAEALLTHITRGWPDDNKARLALVRAWLAQDKLEEGIRVAGQMAEAKDEFAPLVTLTLAEALAQKGDFARAQKLVQDLYALNRNDESLALGAATLLAEDGKLDPALAVLGEYRQRHPDSFKAAALQAGLLGEAKRFKDATALLDALSTTLKQDNATELKEIQVQLLQNQQQWAASLDLLAGLLQEKSDHAPYHISAGYACQKLGRLAEAEAHYREALALDGGNPETLNTLGYFLAETRQKLDEALALTLKAHQLDPTAGHILDSLGWVYFQKGEYAKAVEQLEKAAALVRPVPESAEIYDHLGDAYDKLGNPAKAREAWRRALELDSTLATVREKLQRRQTGGL